MEKPEINQQKSAKSKSIKLNKNHVFESKLGYYYINNDEKITPQDYFNDDKLYRINKEHHFDNKIGYYNI